MLVQLTGNHALRLTECLVVAKITASVRVPFIDETDKSEINDVTRDVTWVQWFLLHVH